VGIAEEEEEEEEEGEEFHGFVLRSFQGVPVVSSGQLHACMHACLLDCLLEQENELRSLAGDLNHGQGVSVKWGESSMGTTSDTTSDTTTGIRCANPDIPTPE
jgi:hypothetical protein